jgi:hypothetical protein
MTSAGSTFTGSAVVTSSTITGNEARDGGGVLNQGGRVMLIGTTVSDNFAAGLSGLVSGDGGGIATSGGLLTLTNTTIANNAALTTTNRGGFVPPGTGGVEGGPVTLDFVTIAGNNVLNEASARVEPTSVGGIRATGTIHNSIVAGNGGLNCGGTLASAGYNLESRHDCGLTGKGDQRDVDPRLGQLDDHGGPTATMALPATSPAVDAADPRCDVATDQRRVARPQGARCDIGAYELLGGGPHRPTALPAPPVTGGGSEPEGDLLGMALLLAPLAAVWLGLAWRRARHARSAAR